MTLQKQGANYDNQIAKQILRSTPDYIQAVPTRGSGNTVGHHADVLVRTPSVDHAVELKKASWATGDRNAIADEDDLRELAGCINWYTQAWFGISMSNRQLMLAGPISGRNVDWEDVGLALERDIPDAFEPTFTESGYLRVTKTGTDQWPSAQAGKSDVDVLLDELLLDRA